MLALLAGALLATGAAAQTGDEIVVSAAQIKQVSVTLGRDGDGRTTCGLGRSSGDVRVDAAVCKRAAKCLGRGTIVPAKVDACVERQKEKLVAAWARGERS